MRWYHLKSVFSSAHFSCFQSKRSQGQKKTMENQVPVKDNENVWRTLFTRLSEGKIPNINEIALQYQSVEGLPPSVTDLNGEREASPEAGNVVPPPEETPPPPESYKDTVPVGTSTGVSNMGRARRGTYKKKKTTSSKRKSSKVTKRKTTHTKRGGAGKRKRSRANIVRRR